MDIKTQIFTFLFLMLGPFKIVGPFAKITQGADPALTPNGQKLQPEKAL